MSFLKKILGKDNNEGQSSKGIDLPWISPADNPWGIKLLDLRPLTGVMISTSKDPGMARNAVSYGNEDGTAFWGQSPESERLINVNLKLPIDKTLEAGVLFTPNTMEHKWAIYFDGESLIFVRSWLRHVFVIAKTEQKDNELLITEVAGEFTPGESVEFTRAVLNFLLISHSIGEIIPAPLPVELEANVKNAGLWAFSTYGNMAHIGIFDEQYLPTTKKVLRSHSLLHIAVARGDINGIETQVQKGVGLNIPAGDGLAPLHWSIASETIESMKKLLDLGADPNAKSIEGATPLMNAVQSNKIDNVNTLLESGAQVNLQDNRGFTALHRASEMGLVDMVKILLRNGADISIPAEGKHTALSLATMTKQDEVIKLLNQ